MAIIIGTEKYRAGVQKIEELKPCPFAGKVTADQIKIALGEWLDIWPEFMAPKSDGGSAFAD